MRPPHANLVLVGIVAAALAGCGGDAGDTPQPIDQLRYPGAMATNADGTVLYVVGTNFDLTYESGVVQAVDLSELNRLADTVPDGEVGTFEVPWVPESGVQIGSFAGRLARAPLEGGGERFFIPLRGGGERPGGSAEGGAVAVVDVLEDGRLACWTPEGPSADRDCRRHQLELLTPGGALVHDPFAAVALDGEVYIGSLARQAIDPDEPTGTQDIYMSRMSVAEPRAISVRSQRSFRVRELVTPPEGGRVFAIGTTIGTTLLSADIRSYEPARFEGGTAPQEFSLYGASAASEGMGLLFSDDGERIYALTRSPSTLVVLTRTGPTADQVRVTASVPLPVGPSRMQLVQALGGDLVAVTASDADTLVFVDPRREAIVGILNGTGCPDPTQPCPVSGRRDPDPLTSVGRQPYDLVRTETSAGGARLVVGSFTDGALRVVDLPDPERPWDARVRAVFRSQTTESP